MYDMLGKRISYGTRIPQKENSGPCPFVWLRSTLESLEMPSYKMRSRPKRMRAFDFKQKGTRTAACEDNLLPTQDASIPEMRTLYKHPNSNAEVMCPGFQGLSQGGLSLDFKSCLV